MKVKSLARVQFVALSIPAHVRRSRERRRMENERLRSKVDAIDFDHHSSRRIGHDIGRKWRRDDAVMRTLYVCIRIYTQGIGYVYIASRFIGIWRTEAI